MSIGLSSYKLSPFSLSCVHLLCTHLVLPNGHPYQEDMNHEACCQYFCKNSENFWRRAKWDNNFLENHVEKLQVDYRQKYPSFTSGGNVEFLYHLLNLAVHPERTLAGNQIVNAKRHPFRLVSWFWKNPWRYFTVIPTGSFQQIIETSEMVSSQTCCGSHDSYVVRSSRLLYSRVQLFF